MESRQNLLVFHSSGLDCAFPIEGVQEIAPMAQLFSPPGLPTLLAGFLDLRGTAVPVLHMDRLFNLAEQAPGLYTPIIILRGGGSPIGILVGSVRQIAGVTPSSFVSLPATQVFNDCSDAAIEMDGRVVHLLCPERILLENERCLLTEFQTVAQGRLRRLEGQA